MKLRHSLGINRFIQWLSLGFILWIMGCNTLPKPHYQSRRIQGESSLYYNYDLDFKLNLGNYWKIRDENVVNGEFIRSLQSNLYSYESVTTLLNKIIHKDWKKTSPLFQAQSMSNSFIKVVGLVYTSNLDSNLDHLHRMALHDVEEYREIQSIERDSAIRIQYIEDKSPEQKAFKYFTVFSYRKKSFGLVDYFVPYHGKLLRFIFCACLSDGFYEDYEMERFKYPNSAGNILKSKLSLLEDRSEEIMASFGPVNRKLPEKPQEDFFNLAYEASRIGTYPNFLMPLFQLRKFKPKATGTLAYNEFEQSLQTFQSFAGNYDSISSPNPKIPGFIPDNLKSKVKALEGFMPIPAQDYIKTQALKKQVVIFNESHVNYQHRRFEESLLKEFYRAGFRYLPMETLNYEDVFLNQRKFPLISTGYYSKEPAFGNLIRTALKLGFTLMPYKDTTTCDYKNSNCRFHRDSIMAFNISKILKYDPNAKILVHAGYAHNEKDSSQNWYPMAKRFKEMTGIDPYCINQTYLTEGGFASRGTWVTYLKNRFHPPSPTVWVNARGESWADSSFMGKADLFVYHPYNAHLFETDSSGDYHQKLTLIFPDLIHGSHQELLVQVYVLSEFQKYQEKAQPVYMKTFWDRFEPFSIFLPADQYIIIYRDQDGNRVSGGVQDL